MHLAKWELSLNNNFNFWTISLSSEFCNPVDRYLGDMGLSAFVDSGFLVVIGTLLLTLRAMTGGEMYTK